MKCVCVILLTGLVFATAAPQEETYTDKWDNVDIEKILVDDKHLSVYHECLMDRGPCTENGEELKRVLPEALKTNCVKCTEAQKRGLEKVLIHLLTKKPKNLRELAIKYDLLGGLFKDSKS